jgi:predicted DCC family thiol-disulfide oxidoreductase YuxK
LLTLGEYADQRVEGGHTPHPGWGRGSGNAEEVRGPVLLYDADCRLCRFTARLVRRLDRDRALSIVPLQHASARPLLESLPVEERLASWRLARPDGSLVGYGAGVVPLLAALRPTRPLARVVSPIPDGALDAAYRFVAGNRTALGRLVPDGPAIVVDQIAATSRASDSTESGFPEARATSRSQRIDSPGA